jgi:tetratricopeptide (TPR) repeat protein
MAEIPPELIAKLKDYSELSALQSKIEQHRHDWLKLSELKERVFQAYASHINSFEFNSDPGWNQSLLNKASAEFLHGKLSIESIAALGNRLDSSIYTKDQRKEIGDKLLECFTLKLIDDNREVLYRREISPESRAKAPHVLEQLDLIERLGEACDGQESLDESRGREFAVLRCVTLLVLGRNEEAKAMQKLIQSFPEGRGSSAFLIGLTTPISDVNYKLDYVRISTGAFDIALAGNPKHFGAAYFLAQQLHMLHQNVSGEEKRFAALRLVAALEKCVELDPSNVYLQVQLTIACHLFVEQERTLSRTSRFAEHMRTVAIVNGNRAMRLLAGTAIAAPNDFLIRLGEMHLDAGDPQVALELFEKAQRHESANREIDMRVACAQGRLNLPIDESSVRPYLEQPMSTSFGDLYAAQAYVAIARQHFELANEYGEHALSRLESAVARTESLRAVIDLMTDPYFREIKDDDRFKILISSSTK